MPIRPKHTLGDGRPVAERQFTDREDLVAVFRKALAAERYDQPRVLVFYGVGGVGKTCLRKELSRLIADDSGVVSATLDFDVPGYREQETALFALRKLLRDKHRVQFPSFDIAYAIHWQKTRPQTPMTRENFPLLEPGTVLADAFDVLGNVTVVGLIPKLAGIALRSGKAVQEWWTRRGSQELRDLPMLEPPQIAERLPMFWAADLKDFLANQRKRAVIFLDTYEALSETERSEGKQYQQDEWVRELVAQLPEVLWVVCGRETLRWDEFDPDWGACLSRHLVGGLAEADARQFLASCGIADQHVRDAIVEGSSGLPYYLDLAVDTYLEIKRQDSGQPRPDDFARSPQEVLARFLRHLTQAEIETLKVLSVPRFWDYELFRALVREFQTGYPLTAFNNLCRFSFINEGAAKGTWTMHQLMRQSLQEHQPQDVSRQVHRSIFEFYAGQLKDLQVKNITADNRVALAEAFHHGKAVLAGEQFFDWFSGVQGIFFEAAQWRFLTPLLEEMTMVIKRTLGPKHAVLGQALNELALLHKLQGRYDTAQGCCQQALEIRREALGQCHPDVAQSLNNLAIVCYEQGRYAEAETIQQQALEIREKVFGPDHPDVARALNNLAALCYRQGKYPDAEGLYQKALQIQEKVLEPNHLHLAQSLNNLASLYRAQGRYAEAEPLLRRALAIWETARGPNHPDVALALNNLAELHRKQAKPAEAETLLLRAIGIWEQAFGQIHPYLAKSLDGLASLYQEQGRYPDAEALYRRALDIREKVLRPDHPDVAEVLEKLAALLQATGRSEEARVYITRARAVRSGKP